MSAWAQRDDGWPWGVVAEDDNARLRIAYDAQDDLGVTNLIGTAGVLIPLEVIAQLMRHVGWTVVAPRKPVQP